ncbi:DUF92 domain-containing protein [Mucilaginibacter psychrotolerans]|uniref:DUF92 domain-containing protein n=1 Tax=Mucilaginibacter psychrotolerans TaxID=1524096 RepID=A0A4Y8SB10_9SPHI|nr:DUF92 domain-containing protein [Mucilaginibacter psychrotolerans]TFF35634.1 DUF92 domain-containing protein [Mucilaginibacter psychrotolerans]
MPIANIVFCAILPLVLLIVYKLRKLTLKGTLTGGLIAIAIFIGAGAMGVALLATFFVLATLATAWKKITKGKTHPQIRNVAQVLANGGLAALLAVLIFIMPAYGNLLAILLAAALSSATADTLSSELGVVYGRRHYHIITFKPDERGRDGVISLEGTLIGVAGSTAIATVYALFYGWGNSFWVIIIAGTAGNLFDSVLGATLERRGYLKNDAVNFLNTLFAALIAWVLLLI